MLLLAAPWLHNLDPFAIRLPGFVGDLLNGGIRWYGLSYLAGFFVGYLLIRRVMTVGVSPLKPAQAADLAVTVAIGIVIGGRLGYVAFYKPELFLDFTPGSFPWWGLLKINQGGMASHGGMIGGVAGCLFFAWRQNVRPLFLLDLMGFGAPLGLLFGRLANFVNGELYGRECARDFPLAVQFPQEMVGPPGWGPEQMKLLKDFADTHAWPPPRTGLAEQAISRIQAGDPELAVFLHEHLTPRYPSQLFAGLTEGVIVFVVVLLLYRRPVKAGLIVGWFSVTYAAMRVINEFFRMPDAHLIKDVNNLPPITRGQLLSFGLFAFGIAMIVFALRSKQDKLGGWMRGSKPPE